MVNMKKRIDHINRIPISRLCVAAAFALLLASVRGNEPVVFSQTERHPASILIAGTSTLHDWEVPGDTIEGRLEIVPHEAGLTWLDEPSSERTLTMLETLFLTPGTLPAVAVEVPVGSLESGKRRMDREMFQALNADRYPFIGFELTSMQARPTVDGTSMEPDGKLTLRAIARGDMRISGHTRSVSFPVAICVRDGHLQISGEVTLRMTDFNLDPPRLMLGALRVGDEITVQFNWAPERMNEK